MTLSIRRTRIPSPVGDLTLYAQGDGRDSVLVGVYFPKSPNQHGERRRNSPRHDSLQHKSPKHNSLQHIALEEVHEVDSLDDALFTHTKTQLDEYFAGERQSFTLPLQLHGNEFNRKVWELLRTIPYGETTTYGAIAAQMGNKKLAQRVGQAVGRNPLSIIIPCHRIIGANGSLTGFAGGLERKRFLLALEEPSAGTAGRLF